jgi:mRNA-degrading endonuclease YafQ of YafQ-DinJ toxin-antitoxin module
MSLKKNLKIQRNAQSVIEYTLLVAVSLLLLLGLGFVVSARDHGLTGHFNTVRDYIENPGG